MSNKIYCFCIHGNWESVWKQMNMNPSQLLLHGWTWITWHVTSLWIYEFDTLCKVYPSKLFKELSTCARVTLKNPMKCDWDICIQDVITFILDRCLKNIIIFYPMCTHEYVESFSVMALVYGTIDIVGYELGIWSIYFFPGF